MRQGATIPELEHAFRVYFADIERCLHAGAHWALLHMLVSLPDVCAALQASTGKTNERFYREWCRAFCTRWDWMTDDDYWEIRNRVLHQGRTVGTTAQGRERRYYKFLTTGPEGGAAHLEVGGAGGQLAVFTVQTFTAAMIDSVKTWFGALQHQANATQLAFVAGHLPQLVTVQEQLLLLPGVGPMTVDVMLTSTG